MNSLPDFVQLMLWVKGQPELTEYPTRDPYLCPVACYIKAQGEPWAAVYQTVIEIRGRCFLLQPQHLIRRLVLAIDRRTDRIISRDHVLVLGRSIARLDRMSEDQIRAQEHAAFDSERERRRTEWGW